MIINSDLHIHSLYSAATSPLMDLPTLAEEAAKKGIQLLGTGDCLHPGWLKRIKELAPAGDGIFVHGTTSFVLTVEVEDLRRVHHLIILPSISKAEELYETFKRYSQDIDSDGRPTIRLTAVEIAEHARDAEALIGPCHAFTPWTALYAYHDSLRECYGDMVDYISFVELGLSADTSYADRITELHRLSFLTNSDAHSPYPIRLAREFNRFELADLCFDELKAAIERRRGRKPVLNVGVPPAEGKYNESACIRCYRHYSLTDAAARHWRCACGGMIKKGVRDRVNELADCNTGVHPQHRPPYLHLIPLAEIISMAIHKSVGSKAVKTLWESLLAEFGTEVNVLVDCPIHELKAAEVGMDPRVVDAIEAFREDKIHIEPGGGGKYGVISLNSTCGEDRDREVDASEPGGRGQLSLYDIFDARVNGSINNNDVKH